MSDDKQTSRPKPTASKHKFLRACELHDLGIQMYREHLGRQHPQASPGEIDKMIEAWAGQPDTEEWCDAVQREWDRRHPEGDGERSR